MPQQTAAHDGSWGGEQRGLAAQVTIASKLAVGFFWRMDYFGPVNPQFSEDGKRLSFAFHGGKAMLTRTGANAALLEVEEGRAVTRMNLKRD
jgi:hypothetical protein